MECLDSERNRGQGTSFVAGRFAGEIFTNLRIDRVNRPRKDEWSAFQAFNWPSMGNRSERPEWNSASRVCFLQGNTWRGGECYREEDRKYTLTRDRIGAEAPERSRNEQGGRST